MKKNAGQLVTHSCPFPVLQNCLDEIMKCCLSGVILLILSTSTLTVSIIKAIFVNMGECIFLSRLSLIFPLSFKSQRNQRNPPALILDFSSAIYYDILVRE